MPVSHAPRIGAGVIVVCLSLALVGRSDDPPAATAPAQSPAAGKSTTASRIGSALKAAADGVKALAAPVEPEEPKLNLAGATHGQLKAVSISGQNGATLQTLAYHPKGGVVGLVTASRYGGVKLEKPPICEVVLLRTTGEEVRRWTVPFTGQSVTVSPDGVILVAGAGKLAQYNGLGEELKSADLPFIAAALQDKEALRAQAEAQLKQREESLARSKQTFGKQITALEERIEQAKKDEKPTDAFERQLKSLQNVLKAYEQMESTQKQTVEQLMDSMITRLGTINAVAATETDLYVACGETKGYGYAIWRMGRDLSEPKAVLNQVSGCCGQMDIQARGDRLYVAENTRHRVGVYDRDGKPITTFGTKGRVSEGTAFGGCCNPMNCRIAPNGDVYTAESEGVVKRFSSEGEFLGLVGQAKLTGGCKNVAVAAGADGKQVFFCDLPGSRVIILDATAQEAPAAP